jgi:predicted RNA-binding protein
MSMNDKRARSEEERIDSSSMHHLCKQHMYYHVIAKTADGQQVEGIITDLDSKHVYMLVPQEMMPVEEDDQEETRQFQRQPYGRPRYRRFFRQIFPLAALAALSLYPYYPPYPYPPYSYPYPYPYPYPYSYPYY